MTTNAKNAKKKGKEKSSLMSKGSSELPSLKEINACLKMFIKKHCQCFLSINACLFLGLSEFQTFALAKSSSK